MLDKKKMDLNSSEYEIFNISSMLYAWQYYYMTKFVWAVDLELYLGNTILEVLMVVSSNLFY